MYLKHWRARSGRERWRHEWEGSKKKFRNQRWKEKVHTYVLHCWKEEYFRGRTSLFCWYFYSKLTTETNILLCCAVQIDKLTTLTDLCTLNTAVIKNRVHILICFLNLWRIVSEELKARCDITRCPLKAAECRYGFLALYPAPHCSQNT